ncbi:hypothetical protein HY949_03965 [Candidatus Gottesmanbacteria bacterium]|nr:hypothetical protein [Candidatus Gottesmanbacteria bacterium]
MRLWIPILLSIISCLLLFVLLRWHYELGLTRYFDVDEFAHLSWAYQMLSGRRPYVDFLFFFPPGFHVFLMPLFAFGSGVVPIIAARLVQFGIFAVLVGVTMLLFWLMRRSWVAILAGVFLAFLPMPFDKFLEIRPDTLAVLFAMLGMVFHILASQEQVLQPRKSRSCIMVAGIFYGISLLILPKTLPQVGVAVGVEFLRALRFPEFLPVRQAGKKGEFRESFKGVWYLLVGLSVPFIFFAIWALTLGNIDQVLYSLTKLPVEANKISQTFIMMPDLFFYPNVTFYGAAGWSTGLIVNHAIWILAIIVGIYRLVAPFLAEKSEIQHPRSETDAGVASLPSMTSFWQASLQARPESSCVSNFAWSLPRALPRGAWNLDNRSQVWSELLIALTFFVYVIFYVQIVPLKHTQYLIPIAVFIAFYAADAIDLFWQKIIEVTENCVNLLPTGSENTMIGRRVREGVRNVTAAGLFMLLFTLYSMGLWGLWRVFVTINTPKLAWTNADTVKQLTTLYKTIPTTEYILDLTGETLYYKHPYVVCCTPFGQSAPYLSRPLPALVQALEKTNTKYIFEGGVKRTTTLLPEDQAYIAAHFLPSPTIEGLLVKKSDQ